MTAIFWYLAIGAIFYIRVYCRVIKPQKDYLIKDFDSRVGEVPFGDIWSWINGMILILCMLMWPALLLKPRTMFTNKPVVFKKDLNK